MLQRYNDDAELNLTVNYHSERIEKRRFGLAYHFPFLSSIILFVFIVEIRDYREYSMQNLFFYYYNYNQTVHVIITSLDLRKIVLSIYLYILLKIF